MENHYNLIVIGAGAAGLVSAYIAAAVKAKVALVESHLMGGDCLNTGCVPSKALIKTAKFLSDLKKHKEFGIKSISYEFDFQDIMARVHQIIQKIEPHDSMERYSALGVHCISGEAKIIDRHTVKIGSQILKTQNIILAMGAEPSIPPIRGLDTVDYLTSNNLWNLSSLPKKLIVLGGGPIGCELAQSFCRLGSRVVQIEKDKNFLSKEDADVSLFISEKWKKEGIELYTGMTPVECQILPSGGKKLLCQKEDGSHMEFEFDNILVAAGRKARTVGINWQELGISLRENGTIKVDEYMRANGKNIFACGDITGPYQFTHVASHQAYYCAVNALFRPIKLQISYKVIPWVTYTDPEIARVGLNEKEAAAQGLNYNVFKYDISDLDRAITDSQGEGFVKVLTDPSDSKGRILGATVVAHQAGEINTEFIASMQHGFGLNHILGTIHSYPTMSEANKYVAGLWKKAQSTRWIMNTLEKFHSMRR